MRVFLVLMNLAMAAAWFSTPTMAESNTDPCKNHYILSSPDTPPRGPIVLPQGDGKLLLASEWRYVAGGPSPRWLRSLAIVKTDRSGTPDTTWADCGIARIPIWGADDEARAAALQPDGKILVLGTALDPREYLIEDYSLEPHSFLALMRLNADGTLDATFARGGRRVFRVGELLYSTEYDINSRASGLIVLPDGRIRVTYPPGRVPVAQMRQDGTIEWAYASAPGQGDVVIELVASIEFVNEAGELFLTSDPDEAVRLDRSGKWFRTGRAFTAPG